MYNYTNLQKFLHYIVLGNKFISKNLFEIEKIIYLDKKKIHKNKHIFISGLPRSGTTLLLNLLYSSNQFASLTYSNMPFILSPNLSKLIPKKTISKKERFHKDGIVFDLESPEAFDEFFFKMFSNNDEIYEFKNLIKLILKSQNKERYLSKNNLNYKRADQLMSLFPNSNFIITIREPYQHAFSLLRQHVNFLDLQTKDNFIRNYMNYLSHNEFGIDHIPWNNPIEYKNTKDINYWLEQWILFYKKIFDKYSKSKFYIFAIYEKIYQKKNFNLLINKIDVKNLTYSDFFNTREKYKIDSKLDTNLYNKAISIYNKFIINDR